MTNKLKREFEYQLEENIKVHKGGQEEFCNKIVLKAPNAKQNEERCMIKHAFLSATTKDNGNTQNSESKNKDIDVPENSQFMMVLYMGLDYKEIMVVFDAFKKLLLDGCATVLDEKLTSYHLSQIDSEVLDDMLGGYISNFLTPSWMKAAMKK